MEKKRLIAWLSEISKTDVTLVGGKGANLGEMFNAKFPVPQAFIVTTQAYDFFIDASGLKQKIDEILLKIDVNDTALLTQKAKEIREIIVSTDLPKELRSEILEAYDHFNVNLSEMKGAPDALAIMRTAREPIFVAVRSSATAEDLTDASFAGQQDSFINVKGKEDLILNVKKVFASSFTARAIYYRLKKGFDSHVGIAVVVQKMINSEKSGVIFSVDPVKTEHILVDAVFGQGEGIVSGRIKPDSYVVSRELDVLSESVADKKIAIVRDSSGITKSVTLNQEKSNQKVLKTYEIKQLADFALKLEEHYKKPQDIEFAIEDGEFYIVQTRAITTLGQKKESEELEGKLLTKGLGASPGVASGVVKIIRSMDDLYKIKQGDVLVTQMTNPDMVVSMQKASAIVTDEGGITAHAAIVSREMGIPAVVGTENATSILEDGQEITVDGYNGKVFLGKAQNKKVEILPIVPTKTKIKVLVDIPEFAERAAKSQANGVGLVRLEGIIASHAKHPLYYEDNEKISEYQEILRAGLEKISYSFIGKEIWVRTSDIRTDEYANLEGAPKNIERNPMLGFHGIRFSLKHPKILIAEIAAIKQLADKGHKFGIMFPQIICVEEVKAVKQLLEEMQIIGHPNIKWGVMIETPAAVTIIKDICQQAINFISLGTNDLTQYILAIDRGNDGVQYLYNEMNPAVLRQLSIVIKACKQAKVETSICGQAASKKEMVEFLVGQGIDSLTVNADAAFEISQFVKELEERPRPAKIDIKD
jgi:pyruvate, water dikinase